MKSLPLSALVACLALLVSATSCSTPQANTRKIAGGAISNFHKLDKNGDGRVTYAEFNEGFADLIFDTYGRGIDGTVSKEEWDAVERANENKAQSSFRMLDRNHDGKLSRDELSHGKRRDAVVHNLFRRIDKNHDGVITLDEARAFGIEHAAAEDPANHP